MYKTIYSLFLILIVAQSTKVLAETDARIIFEENNSILDFTVASTGLSEVFKFMGHPAIENPENGGHDFANYCFRDENETTKVTFITGVIHDYSTLYGFRISDSKYDKNARECYLSDKVNNRIRTKGGLSLYVSRSAIEKILGGPSKNEGDVSIWKYEFKEVYKSPKYKSWQAGPTNKKYTQKMTIVGEYHSGQITAVFDLNRLVSLEVIDTPEADFSIQNLYDDN